MDERRYPSLEGLRFLTSLAIVLHHFVLDTERGLTLMVAGSNEYALLDVAIPVTFGTAILSCRFFEEPARQMITSSLRGPRLA